jgi:ABC-type lipoprotein release transport system permease subunit
MTRGPAERDWRTRIAVGVSGHDAATLVAVCLLILLVATVASWLPARRAAAVDAAGALRSE